MSVVVVTGDGSTTTSLALAATWPLGRETVVIEADPSGGSLSAWLDLPRRPGLSELVSRPLPFGESDLDTVVQRARSGVQVVVAPVAVLEARAAVSAAGEALNAWSRCEGSVAIIDAGQTADILEDVAADVVVVVHRQDQASVPAAAVRLERLRDRCASLAGRGPTVITAIRGRRPYGPTELAEFLGTRVVELADDPFAAAVLAGRASSARRLAVAPLMRSAAALAARIDSVLSLEVEEVDA